MVVRKGSWFLFEILSDEAEEGNVFAWVSIEVRWFSELRVFAGRNFRLIRRESRRLSRKRVRKKLRLKFLQLYLKYRELLSKALVFNVRIRRSRHGCLSDVN